MRTVRLGIQDFAKIIEDDLFYVDKTGFIGEWYRKKDDITLITLAAGRSLFCLYF